jgi:hypothetical protein
VPSFSSTRTAASAAVIFAMLLLQMLKLVNQPTQYFSADPYCRVVHDFHVWE